VTEPGLVLDADAVLGYAQGSFLVGSTISRVTDQGKSVVVPVLCLAEAYRRATGDEWKLLDVLGNVPGTVVTPVNPGDAQFLGGHARALGSMHLAHAVLAAATHTIVAIMTSQRDRVTRILAKEWPIIDL
jgi:hypothetical protein